MEVRPGYKQTEVGVIPEGWTVKAFQEATHLITCGVAATPTYVRESVGKPFLSAQNVRNGHVVLDNHKYISCELFEQITRHNKPERGDLLYTRVGAGIGEAGIVESDFAFGIYVSLTLIKVDPHQLFNGFVLHLLNSPRYRFLAKNGQFAGGGVQNLNVEVVRKFPIPLPSLSEQRAIAVALSDVDDLLAKLDQLIAKKRDIKQAAMQQLLTGQIRLPQFSGEWKVKRLGDLVEIRKGQLITEKDAIAGDVPVIAGGKKPSYFHNLPNRVGKTITVSASGASAGYVAFFDSPIFASDCSTIGECRKYSIEFIYFQLLAKQGVIYKAQTGGAQPHIHAIDLIPLEIGTCSLQEQTAIAAVLSDMDTEIAALEARRDKTRDLKQGMMQELLTGRIRLV